MRFRMRSKQFEEERRWKKGGRRTKVELGISLLPSFHARFIPPSNEVPRDELRIHPEEGSVYM